MIEIDASFGEGGGQVLRTALALSALSGEPVRLYQIRSGRSNPGLAPQHLAAVRAAAALCAAEVSGANLRSTEVTFKPNRAPQPGDYTIDVTEAAGGGSAGAVTLLLQTVMLPLALAGGGRLHLRGGTHVPWSPSYHYLAHVLLPALARMGVRVDVDLRAWGFYPAGGGEILATVHASATPLSPITLVERGPLRRVWGEAVAANLPAHIPQRMASRAHNLLANAGIKAEIRPVRVRAAGPGAGLFLVAEHASARMGFASLGARGKPSEQVAEEACLDLLANERSGQAVDMHLADQLLLPMALGAGQSSFGTCRLTSHLITNAHIIRKFLPAVIEIKGREGEAGLVQVGGAPEGLTNGPRRPLD